MRAWIFFALALMAAALAGCSNGAGAHSRTSTELPAASGTATYTPSPVPTPVPSAAATTAPAPTRTPLPEACGRPATEPAMVDGRVTVNADGDGVPDTLLTYADSPDPGVPHLIELVLDGARSVTVRNTVSWVPVAPIGGLDVDGDGRDELFAETGNGAYTTYVDVFEFDAESCTLVRLAAGDYGQPQFLVGASVQNGAALSCKDGLFVSTGWELISDDPLRFRVSTRSYAIAGTTLRLVSQTQADLEHPSPAFECGDLRLPPDRSPPTAPLAP